MPAIKTNIDLLIAGMPRGTMEGVKDMVPGAQHLALLARRQTIKQTAAAEGGLLHSTPQRAPPFSSDTPQDQSTCGRCETDWRSDNVFITTKRGEARCVRPGSELRDEFIAEPIRLSGDLGCPR